ncbi:MAG: Tyrosyl-tRNA synthetase [archaeon GW2011_AR20]|nr:MAG: Tyrosyl-tRNA synthetase [archaeon GW2011_AR20]MBS3160610.1 tyrosine--tRNA ligase [Candidatus Woesearchaeota archaeon]
MDLSKRFELIKRNSQEILTENELKGALQKKKQLSAYYGTAPTGLYHMGYLVPLSKLFDFDKAGIKNKVLIANIHAALDDLKTPWEKIDFVGNYYQKCIELSFPWDKKPRFVRGSSFQLTKEYQLDVLKLSALSTVARTTRAASEVTRMKNPKVSELIYPIMQALDEEYLDVDIQLGGQDQRHILAYAREYLPLIKYEPRIEIMTPLIVSLRGPGVKMSASIPESRILVHDPKEVIEKNINNAYCPAGIVQDNPILQLAKFIVFSVKDKFKIERDKKFGGNIVFNNYNNLEKEFVDKKIHPSDLKNNLSKELTNIFSKVRNYFEKNQDLIPKV